MSEFCECDPDGNCTKCGRKMKSCVAKRHCRPGLGDYVEMALSSVGITKERVEKITGKPCGCGKRQEALNRLGRKLTG
jgi:hypothetical protein